MHCHLPTRDAHTEKYERGRERDELRRRDFPATIAPSLLERGGKLGGVDNLVPFANSRSQAR